MEGKKCFSLSELKAVNADLLKAALSLANRLGNSVPETEAIKAAAEKLAGWDGRISLVTTGYEHHHGHDLNVFEDFEQAQAYKNRIAIEWWDGEIDGESMPQENPGDAYFEIMCERDVDAEYFSVQETFLGANNELCHQ